MSEMVERVARAIFDAESRWAPILDHQFEENKKLYLEAARAAIDAMREPTRAMVGEAMIQPHPTVAEAGGVLDQGRATIKIDYQAMIDAALTPDRVP